MNAAGECFLCDDRAETVEHRIERFSWLDVLKKIRKEWHE